MNYVPAIALAATAVGIHSATVWHRLSAAPGWAHHRWFGVAAVAAAAYAFAGFLMNTGVPDTALPLASAAQIAAAVVSVWAWLRYADGFTGATPRLAARAMRAAYLGLAVPGLLFPGALFRSAATSGHVAVEGALEYRDVGATPLGTALILLVLWGAVPLSLRFAAAWRRGVPLAGVHLAAIGAVIPVAVSDVLTSMGVLAAPYLMDVGFVLPVAIVASATSGRFVREAREHEALRGDLERAVAQRTRQLGRAQLALHEAERLAALGHFAAGIAHEVNNPAAAVSVNLRYIREHADAGPGQAEVREAADEGLEAMNRIVALVRRLSEAGRLAGAAAPGQGCIVAEPVVRAIEDVSARFPDGRVSFRTAPLPGVRVAAPEGDVHHALQALLLNAAEAVPPVRPGSVDVRVIPAGGRVEIHVEDDGVGLGEEALARAFQPFFSTKPPGQGPGLGLTLAQAVARRHGGDVRLERRPGGGARAVLALPAESTPDPAGGRRAA